MPGGRFFSEPVEWAHNNGVTTGTSASTFEPDKPVTRGENITFTYRYDQQIVQPALGDRYTKAQVDAAIADAVAGMYTKAQVDAAVAAAVTGTATITSGMTVIGNTRYDQHGTNAGADYWISVDLRKLGLHRTLTAPIDPSAGAGMGECSLVTGSPHERSWSCVNGDPSDRFAQSSRTRVIVQRFGSPSIA